MPTNSETVSSLAYWQRAESAEEWIDLPLVSFDLQKTLESGQVFHWEVGEEICQGLVDQEMLLLRLREGRWQVPHRLVSLAFRYFALDHPLEEIWRTFPKDCFSQAALSACKGLRIIRQPKWECLATFITSPLKQISHIRKMSLRLRKEYGNPLPIGYAYPTPEVFSSLKEEDLRACGLGFRARNLLGAARVVVEGSLDLQALASMETGRVREVLVKIPGVGEKVAHCVLLFAYERLEVVPIDVWIGRVLHHMRQGRREAPADTIRRHFGPYAGYVQQYLFHYARTSKMLPSSK